MPPEEADSTDGTAKPRQLAEPEECPGGAKIKPPFEMGVSDLEVRERKAENRKNEVITDMGVYFNPNNESFTSDKRS